MKQEYAEPPPIGFSTAPPAQPGYQWGNPPQGYPPPSQPQQQVYPQPGYPQPPQPGYPQHGYPQPGYPQPGYPPQYYGEPPSYGSAPPAPPPTQPPFHPQPQVMVVNNGGWYSRNQRNKPQSNAVGAASLIFVSGGMNIAWSIGFHGKLFYNFTEHNFIAWFIGAIIGALVSCVLTNKVPKKLVVIFSSVLVMIGGIVIASTKNNANAALACSYLDGIANGLIFAPFMALAGEVSVSYMRGLITASIEQMCFGLGIFLQIVYSSSWTSSQYNDFSSENMKGVLSAIYGFIALILGSLLCIESPVIMLANNDEQGAIDALRRLQRPYTLTNETFEQLAEHKKYLAQNKELSVGQSIGQAIPTFLRLAMLRGFNAISISSYVRTSYIYFFVNLAFGGWTDWYAWFIGFALSRWMGNFITAFCMESVGRKKTTLLGLLVCGVLAIVMAAQFNIFTYNTGNNIIMIVFQFFAGVAFTATSPFLSEAYPLGVKQHFIAFTFIVEMLVLLITNVCNWTFTGGANYFYAAGGLYLFGFALGIFVLPETRRTTLREAQDKFRGLISTGF